MKILFICSGNNKANGISPFIQSQADSLVDFGLQINLFIINKRGLAGYFKHIFKLRSLLKTNSFDIVHAHYSLSALVAGLAGAKPLVVSLLGSDAYIKGWLRWLTNWFYWHGWVKTIVKTTDMKSRLKMDKAIVLPNGVNINNYKHIDKKEAKDRIGYKSNKKLILFVANPERHEKNYPLALQAYKMLNVKDVELMPVYNKPSEEIPYFMNAADVLLLTSKWEGSVNVVKEAMACGLPIVSTDVGDVNKNISGVTGCYITSNNPEDIKQKIEKALEFNQKTNGREKLISLGLDSVSIAKKLQEIYQTVLNNGS